MISFDPVSPQSAGLSPKRILRFIERLEEKQVPMHSFQFLCKDKLISEGYYAPYDKNTMHRMFSISKSITALAIGFLEHEGKLSLSDKIISHFPDKLPEHPHPWLCDMTIRDMLMMRTCHASTTYKIDMTKDWVQSFFITPPSHPAGQIFHYDTSAAHVLCALAERLSGQKIWDYFRQKLSVLELSEESYFLTDPFGVSLGGTGLVCLPKDLLKIAYFVEHGGVLDDQEFLSPDYLRAATSFLTPTCVTAPLPSEACGYGYQIWRNQRGGYTFYGMGGQLMIFVPEQDFICITTADTQGMAGGNQLIYDALYEEILPYLGKDSSESDPLSQEELLEKYRSLSIRPLPYDPGIHTPMMNDSPLTYTFLENGQGFKSMRLSFEEAAKCDCTPSKRDHRTTEQDTKQKPVRTIGHLTLFQDSLSFELHFGFGDMYYGIFPKYGQKYAASASWLESDTLYVKFHIIDAYVGSVHIQIHFDHDKATLFLKKQEESLFQEFKGHLTGIQEQ